MVSFGSDTCAAWSGASISVTSYNLSENLLPRFFIGVVAHSNDSGYAFLATKESHPLWPHLF